MKRHTVVMMAFLFVVTISCRYSRKQVEAFNAECSGKDTIHDLSITFSGFDKEAVAIVTVKERNEKTIVDSFYIFPTANDSDNARHKRFEVSLTRPINVKHSYDFILPNGKIFSMTDIHLRGEAQPTMTGETLVCRIGDFKINGVVFNYPSPAFINDGK